MSGYCRDCGNTLCICKNIRNQETAVSNLSARIKKLAAFDLTNMGPPNRQHRWRNEGAAAENARLTPLLEALAECAGAITGEKELSDFTMAALAHLESALKRLESRDI